MDSSSTIGTAISSNANDHRLLSSVIVFDWLIADWSALEVTRTTMAMEVTLSRSARRQNVGGFLEDLEFHRDEPKVRKVGSRHDGNLFFFIKGVLCSDYKYPPQILPAAG